MRKQKSERRGSKIIWIEERNYEISLSLKYDEFIRESDGKYRK
tara:strand:+ start:451 stop:579 length:129 start_codon:yes stop_codon:yes gene_type:complete